MALHKVYNESEKRYKVAAMHDKLIKAKKCNASHII